jgi:2-polyprenyl-3-methyl-5-hydroxy-6-metoxy-1,4-benzoquinol methylase
MAPRTGDLTGELVSEAAEYFRLTTEQVRERMANAAQQFKREWLQRVGDAHDERAIVSFYNETDSEIFELLAWHASDTIHYRTLVCVDIAARQPGRRCLDFGSGIGSDAIVFADAGFDVTLADVSEPLLAFARWRCERRGHKVRTIDLKTQSLPASSYDAAICFDVLEHIPKPMRTLGQISRALTAGGLLFVHAPFGVDSERPMHVVHADIISERMRTVGFNWRGDLEAAFPSWLWAPRVYERFDLTRLDAIGYYVHDVLMPGTLGARMAALYRYMMPKRHAPPV